MEIAGAVAGFVLTGGKSSRMGRDKARLPVGDRAMVEAIATTLAGVTGEVLLVGNPERYGDLPFDCLPDLRPGMGPLSGIETGLASGKAHFNVVVACDLADLQPEWIASLIAAMSPGVLCAAALDKSGKLQPLCAIYRSECLETVKQALDTGRLRALDLLRELKATAVKVDAEIWNINTPAEFQKWVERRATIR